MILIKYCKHYFPQVSRTALAWSVGQYYVCFYVKLLYHQLMKNIVTASDVLLMTVPALLHSATEYLD